MFYYHVFIGLYIWYILPNCLFQENCQTLGNNTGHTVTDTDIHTHTHAIKIRTYGKEISKFSHYERWQQTLKSLDMLDDVLTRHYPVLGQFKVSAIYRQSLPLTPKKYNNNNHNPITSQNKSLFWTLKRKSEISFQQIHQENMI